MRPLGSSIGTSRFSLHSPLPGRLNYVDYKRILLASSFLLGLISEGTPTEKMREGRRMQFWCLSSEYPPVESLPTKVWTPTRQQFWPCLSRWGNSSHPYFSGLGEVKGAPLFLHWESALSLCVPFILPPPLHSESVKVPSDCLLENPSYSCWESNNAEEERRNLLAPHNSCHIPFLGQTDPAGSHQWHRQSSPVSCLIQGYTPEYIASFTCPGPLPLARPGVNGKLGLQVKDTPTCPGPTKWSHP